MLEAFSIARHWWEEGTRLRPRDRTAWSRLRERGLHAHLAWVARHSPFYQGRDAADIASWPIVSKAAWMGEFDRINTEGLERDACEAVALRAERERDFSPTVRAPRSGRPMTVGLSSGTSGARGLFVASASERSLWAGVILRRILPDLWRGSHRVALVLRSDSNLYRTLGGGRVRFRHHDLHTPWPDLAEGIAAQDPTLLAAPPSVLDMLARSGFPSRLRSLRRILSIAEVLDPSVEDRITRAFGLPVGQIYQCTEGLLATPCPLGTLHLHEEHILVEREWLDQEQTRFRPVITDFRRRVQPVVRYRLEDVLVPTDCGCGRHAQAIARIEGRCDDILRPPSRETVPALVFPDFVRRLVLETLPSVHDWMFIQTSPSTFDLALPHPHPDVDGFLDGWTRLCRLRGAHPGQVRVIPWTPPPRGAKLRRVVGLPPL